MFMKTLAFLAAMLGSDEGRSAPPAQPAPVRVAQATAAPARTASAVVDRVQAFYRDTQQLSAVFRQTTRNETFGKTSTSDGRVYLKKPGKM
ncbi:MAG TPA: outer membrane lipoprotein carrier protein LolA, partial [Kofleriaceae bacterium]|nr:outer membrane lipoprotein carrier protein LolA [Kofleriaceae bacterium]